MGDTVRLYHPPLDRHIDVTVRQARVKKKSGWVELDEAAPPKTGAGSGRDAWAEYASSIGIHVDGDDTRDDIVAKVEIHTAEEA